RFIDRLPGENFLMAIKKIGAKGGIVANNGIQTLIQAILLESPVLYYLNKNTNKNFINQLADLLTTPVLNETAKVMLGISDKPELLEDSKNMELVRRTINTHLLKSIAKFEEAKIDTDALKAKEICDKLQALTSIKWNYNARTKIATAK